MLVKGVPDVLVRWSALFTIDVDVIDELIFFFPNGG